MSALQDSSHSREQSLERKPSEVSTHRLPQSFEVMSNNKMKTLASHQLLAPQNLATSVSIVPASLAGTPRVTLPPSMLQQALGPRLTPGFSSRLEAKSGMSSAHAVNTVTAKLAFSAQPQALTQAQQMAVNLGAHATCSAGPGGMATQPNQLPMVAGQTIAHPGLYGITSTLGARQIPMVSPRLSVPAPLGGVAIPKVAALSDLRLQAPHSTPMSHLPKGAVAAAAASALSAPRAGHAAIARPIQAPTGAAIQLQQPMISGLVIQNPPPQHQKLLMPTGQRAVTPAMPRSSMPNVSLVTSPASRVPGISLQSPGPWSSSASIAAASAVQLPLLQAKSQTEGLASPLGSLTTANIFQQTLRPVGHLGVGAQQASPLQIRAQTQKVLLSGPLTSLAPASMGHSVAAAGAVVATVTRITDLPVSHSMVPAIARPTTMLPSASLPMASVPQVMPGTNSTGQSHPVNMAPKSHRVILSNPPPKPTPALPVPSISISKMGAGTLPSSTGMNLTRAPKKNIRLQSATTSAAASHPGGATMPLPPVVAKTGVPVVSNIRPQATAAVVSSMAAVPVAKVPPQAYAVQQLTSEACRLVSHSGQALTAQQFGQQHPRPAVAPGSQIIPIQPNALFLGSGCLQSTALPLSIPMTSTDSRQPNEHGGGPMLHQVSYALPDGARYLTQQQLMSLSNAVNYAPLQPLQTITLQGSTNLRPGLVTTQTQSLAVTLQGSTHSVVAPALSSAVAMANQSGRLNTSVVVAMDTSRLASLTIPQNFAGGDGVSRSGDSAISQSSVTLSQGLLPLQQPPLQQQQQPQQQQQHHHHQLQHQQQQQQPTVIALMQPPQQAAAPGVLASSVASSDSVKQQTMSPRPPILRKRNHDGAMTSAAKKSLFPSVGSLPNDPGGSTAPNSAPPDGVGHLVLASPKSFDASRENSQSSTDTASSAESTPRSCPSSAKRVKEEPQDCAYENGVPTDDPGMKIVPRKKPRKQSLHANEEIPDGFSTDEDEPDHPSINLSLNTDVVPTDDEQDHRAAFAPHEYVDEEGFRWTHSRMRNVTISGDYVFNNKPRNNHFVSSADVKVKDERRPTVNELANTMGIQQNANGSKINGLSYHFTNLAAFEGETVDRLKAIQLDFPTKASSKQLPSDDDLRVIPEILLANVQRCRSYVDQLCEVKECLQRVLRRKPQAYEIIAKHQSKRTVKKKERS